MKTTLKSLGALGLIATCLGAAPIAQANVEMDTDGNGSFDVSSFTQFDWEAPGNAVFVNAGASTTGAGGATTLGGFFAADAPGSTVSFDFHYQARLVAFTGAPNSQWAGKLADSTLSCISVGSCYEVTLAVTARETATLTRTSGVDGYQELTFTGITGSFKAFIDGPGWPGAGPNSVATTGAGYIDGKEFMSGTLTTVTGSFQGVGAVNPSGFNTIGTITSADSSILRAVGGATIVGSEFRTNVSFFGNPGTEAITVGGTIGPGGYVVVAGDLVRQADANQPFITQTVPEPSTLLLLGGSMLGLVGLRRRYKV